MDDKASESRAILQQAWECSPPMGNDMDRAIRLSEKAIAVDNRNVLAYHTLARLYLKRHNLDEAEHYCKRGYGVEDIPQEIRKPAIGVDDVRRETADDFDQLMFEIRMNQGRSVEAKEYLEHMKQFFDAHGKGKYHVTKRLLEEGAFAGAPTPAAPKRTNYGSVVVIVLILLIVLVALIRGC